jgi:hypothetical protein
MQCALRTAVTRYGERIAISGSDTFKEQILMAAVAGKFRIAFADAASEKRYLQLVRASSTEEESNAMRVRLDSRYAEQREHRHAATTPAIQHGKVTPPAYETICHGGPVAPGGGVEGADNAAGKYIAERQLKRITGFDIPEHRKYTALNQGDATYAGTRWIDGRRWRCSGSVTKCWFLKLTRRLCSVCSA